jgi:hypothetical protein
VRRPFARRQQEVVKVVSGPTPQQDLPNGLVSPNDLGHEHDGKSIAIGIGLGNMRSASTAAILAVGISLLVSCGGASQSATGTPTPASISTSLSSAKAAAIAAGQGPQPSQEPQYIVHLRCPSGHDGGAFSSASAAALAEYEAWNQLQATPATANRTQPASEAVSPAAITARANTMKQIWAPDVLVNKQAGLDRALAVAAVDPTYLGYTHWQIASSGTPFGTANKSSSCVTVTVHPRITFTDGTTGTGQPSPIKLHMQLTRSTPETPWQMVAFTDEGPPP